MFVGFFLAGVGARCIDLCLTLYSLEQMQKKLLEQIMNGSFHGLFMGHRRCLLILMMVVWIFIEIISMYTYYASKYLLIFFHLPGWIFKSPDHPDRGDSPWLLQLSIHSPQECFVIIYELRDRFGRIRVSAAAAK